MKRSWVRKLFFLVTLLGFLAIAVFFFYLSNGVNLQTLFQPELKQVNRQVTIYTLPESQFHGWIAGWDEKNAFSSYDSHKQFFKTVSPVWYQVNNQGVLVPTQHTLDTELKVSTQKNNIPLMPTVSSVGDPANVSFMLNEQFLRNKLIDDLIHAAKDAGYSGYDIDFEEISPLDQPQFTMFVKELSDKLHQENLKLALSVPAPTGESSDRDIVKGYDLVKLSESADYIKVMAYDFHYQTSAPGAITPLDKLDQVLNFASLQIPNQKLILGLPTYGYDWPVAEGSKADPVTFTQAQEKIASFSGTVKRDDASDSLVSVYQKEGKAHQIWFEDAQTIQMFIKKARSYGVYQFSFWRIGAEDPSVWNNLNQK